MKTGNHLLKNWKQMHWHPSPRCNLKIDIELRISRCVGRFHTTHVSAGPTLNHSCLEWQHRQHLQVSACPGKTLRTSLTLLVLSHYHLAKPDVSVGTPPRRASSITQLPATPGLHVGKQPSDPNSSITSSLHHAADRMLYVRQYQCATALVAVSCRIL